ncbi:hypothetical protein ACODM8_12455 [Vibrio ostreicida]|uniref:hypothetical protein n=1 Tax=Vibrio ostreicida TaxID=526588 RepID=UPI003B5A479E
MTILNHIYPLTINDGGRFNCGVWMREMSSMLACDDDGEILRCRSSVDSVTQWDNAAGAREMMQE